MPSFYYVDMYFDSEFGAVVRGVIEGMLACGSKFKRATIQEHPESKTHHSFTGTANLASFVDLSEAYVENLLNRGQSRVTFPAWGRILFEYEFDVDEDHLDDLIVEESESKTNAMDIGIGFLYTQGAEGAQSRTQVTFSLWEDYLLAGIGTPNAHAQNMTRLLRLVESVYDAAYPVFAVLNNEIHISIDRSYDRLKRFELPYGNDYVIVGRALLNELDIDELRRQGLPCRLLSDGGVLIQFNPKWA